MTSIFAGFNANYNKLKVDTTSAQSFLALKNFFTYVDDLEFIVNKKQLFNDGAQMYQVATVNMFFLQIN